MRRLTDHCLLAAGISLLLCPQAFATSSRIPYLDHRFMYKGTSVPSAQARSVPRNAARPAVAVPPEVLNLQLRPPVSKP